MKLKTKGEITMIDFQNSEYLKLKEMNQKDSIEAAEKLIIPGEQVITGFKTIRDKVIFTNKRIITMNVQGLTGKRVDYTSIPYSKIQTYSVETSGTFDMDCEIEVWLSSVGRIKFEIIGGYDITELSHVISEYIL